MIDPDTPATEIRDLKRQLANAEKKADDYRDLLLQAFELLDFLGERCRIEYPSAMTHRETRLAQKIDGQYPVDRHAVEGVEDGPS